MKQLIEEKAAPEEAEQTVGLSDLEPRRGPCASSGDCHWRPGSCRSARVFAHMRVEGLEHLQAVDGPVLFASNHQSHMDVPVILAALPGRWRARVAPAMLKEFFTAHFHPAEHTWRQWFTNSLNYYLACFYFNTFPIPQREAGARHTLRYMGRADGRRLVDPDLSRRGAGGHRRDQAVPRRRRA